MPGAGAWPAGALHRAPAHAWPAERRKTFPAGAAGDRPPAGIFCFCRHAAPASSFARGAPGFAQGSAPAFPLRPRRSLTCTGRHASFFSRSAAGPGELGTAMHEGGKKRPCASKAMPGCRGSFSGRRQDGRRLPRGAPELPRPGRDAWSQRPARAAADGGPEPLPAGNVHWAPPATEPEGGRPACPACIAWPEEADPRRTFRKGSLLAGKVLCGRGASGAERPG